MADMKNFLIGEGERLVTRILPPLRNPGEKWTPYKFLPARARLSPRVAQLSSALEQAPDALFPEDRAVALLTLHPAFIAKSYFPGGLLKELQLDMVGSRPRTITPAITKGASRPTVTSELFVAGERDVFRRWAKELPRWTEGGRFDQLVRLEDVRLPHVEDKLRGFTEQHSGHMAIEVVLHADAVTGGFILEGFHRYLRSLGINDKLQERIQVGGLTFIALDAPRELVERIAAFSFLRVIRPLPVLRAFWPDSTKVLKSEPTATAVLPAATAASQALRVAVLDGGVPPNSVLSPWVTSHSIGNVVKPTVDQLAHGLQVTSALLFGPIEPGKTPPPPPASVDHFQVVDARDEKDHSRNYYRVLGRVQNFLNRRSHSFVNLSIGAALPVVDDEVHPWTAILDQHLATGDTFVTVASGNGGHHPADSGMERVQSPADSVNALVVGACDSMKKAWRRAGYSSYGTGRSRMKPDGVAFGGTDKTPFFALADPHGKLRGVYGTSISAPNAMRTALMMRAELGPVLHSLALRTLMVHGTERGRQPVTEVGWGRFPQDPNELLVCGSGEARILYQGIFVPGSYMRMPIPIPPGGIKGEKVEITATFCFASPTDPEDPLAYTRAGLDITFRPNSKKLANPKAKRPVAEADSFFTAKKAYATEQDLRNAHKWETTRHAQRRFNEADLVEPYFEVHYNAREGGAPSKGATNVPYALVVTVRCPGMPDLYNRILQHYRTQLRPLVPLSVQVPLPRG
ncbi:S8 family peptidase [Pyxidicoccus xibeiensis]|uniref:S8 family peptidase n=1 Tax=Pyxidicoccus xibeiensis TaxID=2906759 RepID=UPI0020A7FDCB|nr:S8 family peptidase [Pyxidicoccus xibeiensis]MCP3139024.1 S8 family peptidase [Pyxidicoccus xibeiensis]